MQRNALYMASSSKNFGDAPNALGPPPQKAYVGQMPTPFFSLTF